MHTYIYIYICSDCFTISNVYSLTYILKILTHSFMYKTPRNGNKLKYNNFVFLIILYYNEYSSWTKNSLKYTSVRKNTFPLLRLLLSFVPQGSCDTFIYICVYIINLDSKLWDNLLNTAAVSATLHLLKLQCTSKHTV